ncbi:hypothetical protein GGF46_000341 [Coemansia sp. RSA 552]|nr:hypothetical protein GGF46_000341 [Coemansia sp. RSA 552]
MRVDLVKRLRQGTAAVLAVANEQWLRTSLALSAYALVWRTYAGLQEAVGPGPSTGGDSVYDRLIMAASVLSYTALGMLLLFPPLFAARYLAGAPLPQRSRLDSGLHLAILFLLATQTTVANITGVVDLLVAPLAGDLLRVAWRAGAAASTLLATLALPLYIARAQYSVPCHLLFLPGIAATAAAADLALVLPTRAASAVLTLAFSLWGAGVIPALTFSVAHIHQSIRQISARRPEDGPRPVLRVLASPLATVSQLALAIMALGVQSRRVWGDTVGPATAPLLLGELAMAAGAILGLIFWAAAAAWFVHSHIAAATAHLRQHDRRLLLWQLPTASAHLMYPLASFTLATIYVTRIWRSYSALLISRLLIVYLSMHLLAMVVCLFACGIGSLQSRRRRRRVSSSGYSDDLDALPVSESAASYGAI